MKQRNSIRNITYIALGAVILSVCSWISLPTPLVPFTLQTFGVFFLICFFGAKRAFLSLLVYIALGLVGVPVFSSFGAGAGVLFGVTGGFIFGFLVSAALCIALEPLLNKNRMTRIALLLLPLVSCYTVGCLWATRFSELGFLKTLVTYAVTFAPFDLIKIVLAVFTADYIKKIAKISV